MILLKAKKEGTILAIVICFFEFITNEKLSYDIKLLSFSVASVAVN